MKIDKNNKLYRLPAKKVISSDSGIAQPVEQVAIPARVAELVDARDLKSLIERCTGSIPVPGNTVPQEGIECYWLCRMDLSIVPVVKVTHQSLEKFPQHAAIEIFENEVDWTDSITHRYKTREIVVRQKDLYKNPEAAALVLKGMIEDSVAQIAKQNVKSEE